jgi:hypothetical protein
MYCARHGVGDIIIFEEENWNGEESVRSSIHKVMN